MAKNGFDRALDILTLAGSAVTLGCLIGLNRKQKKEKTNVSENTADNETTTETVENSNNG